MTFALNKFYVFDTEDFNSRYEYHGDDLGYTWTTKQTVFKLWAPMADECNLILYADGHLGGPYRTIAMEYEQPGVWCVTAKGNFNNYYYNFEVKYDGEWSEVADPYAKAAGINGKRCMIVNFEALNPEGWEEDANRSRTPLEKAVIYEGHVRDLTVNANSGVKDKGLFTGLSEHGTVNSMGKATGLDYIKNLGVTHLHLLPVNDFETINEDREEKEYNWGYDPKHFSALEGSYSSNPYRGSVRIKEFKNLVLRLHKAQINVVLDVVYSHTFRGTDGDLYKVFPGFYHRSDSNGVLTNGSGCGNELATERFMVRKFIVDSILFWAREYHIDGFRIDLMGLYDIETLKNIREELNLIDPSIIIYGEPWTGGNSALDPNKAGIKSNLSKMPYGVAAFSDDLRDAVKGDVFNEDIGGFAHGNIDCRETVKKGIVGACEHPEINNGYLIKQGNVFSSYSPLQAINYVSSHDNLTLFDKLMKSGGEESLEIIKKRAKLCAAIVFTSQGVPFFSEGEEFLRSKEGDADSYNAGDAVNAIDWDRQNEYMDVVEYYKGLIKLRKRHPAFRMTSQTEICENIKFYDTENNQLITYVIYNNANGDTWGRIAVIFNASAERVSVELPCAGWNVVVDGEASGVDSLRYVDGNILEVDGISAVVAVM